MLELWQIISFNNSLCRCNKITILHQELIEEFHQGDLGKTWCLEIMVEAGKALSEEIFNQRVVPPFSKPHLLLSVVVYHFLQIFQLVEAVEAQHLQLLAISRAPLSQHPMIWEKALTATFSLLTYRLCYLVKILFPLILELFNLKIMKWPRLQIRNAESLRPMQQILIKE